MSDKLTKKQEKELQKLADEMVDFASDVVGDYRENPSEISGSTIQINENSPYLYDWLEGDKWKKVLSYMPKELMNKKDKDDTE